MRLRPEVRAFAQLMERELRENDHKPGWRRDRPRDLHRRVGEEAEELGSAVDGFLAIRADGIASMDRGSIRRTLSQQTARVGKEAADVANMAMMVADVCGCLAQPQSGKS